ncbi:MAG TPA: magnesium/cobalt transporter CorA, partial [Candidatus Binatia bacterium]|nr:magnesium/cobalt transporter CorA [Candidatus Binatia bacterium]
MIINCVAYENGRKLADISADDVSTYIARPNCFVWVALKEPEPAELRAMQHEFGLHELALEDAQHGHQRPKIDEYNGSLFVVLHLIELENDDLNVGELAIFAGPKYVLSVRSRAERGLADVRARCEQEPDLLRHGPGYVLYALMDAVVDRYFPVLDSIESAIEGIEELIFADQPVREHIEALYSAKRKLMILKHATEPLLEATAKLFGGRVPQLCVALQDYFRDVYDHLLRLNQAIDSLRDMVTTGISVTISLISIQENAVTKRLASYGALIAVPTLIAGVYGMNFQNMPEIAWYWGYPFALLMMAGIDVYLFY